MKTIANILKKRIEELGYQDIKECARDLEIPYELLRKVISNGHIPKDSTLEFYAGALGLDRGELIQTAYRQKVPNDLTHIISPVPRPTVEGSQRQAPVLGRAACGAWLESYGGEADDYEPVDTGDREAFFVMAEGDSMVGGNIPSGALLLVSPSTPVANGQVVLARRGEDEFTVKTYFRKADGTVILQPMNPAFEPIINAADEPVTVMRITEVRIKL